MEEYKVRIIESIFVLVSYLFLRIIIQGAIKRARKKFAHQVMRAQVIKKLINVLLFFICFQVLLFIWGVDQSQLIFFISSMLTVVGIAFFAQWSIISNITSALIIFFSHPAGIGDTITFIDKDCPVEGEICDIEVFFIILKTAKGDKITIPNNIFMQKVILKKNSA